MFRIAIRTMAPIVCVAALAAPGLGFAQDTPLNIDDPLSTSEVALTPEAPVSEAAAAPTTAESDAKAMQTDELADMSGGSDTVNVEATSNQKLLANSHDNTIEAGTVNAGDVSFAGSLGNFNGIGNFVVNTGMNNVLQGSISVTIATTAPAP